jgi:hypothetical protein
MRKVNRQTFLGQIFIFFCLSLNFSYSKFRMTNPEMRDVKTFDDLKQKSSGSNQTVDIYALYGKGPSTNEVMQFRHHSPLIALLSTQDTYRVCRGLRSAMSNSILPFATIVANEFGYSPHQLPI